MLKTVMIGEVLRRLEIAASRREVSEMVRLGRVFVMSWPVDSVWATMQDSPDIGTYGDDDGIHLGYPNPPSFLLAAREPSR